MYVFDENDKRFLSFDSRDSRRERIKKRIFN